MYIIITPPNIADVNITTDSCVLKEMPIKFISTVFALDSNNIIKKNNIISNDENRIESI